MIALENVSKSYHSRLGSVDVLKNVNIVFPQDKNVGVLGLNGAGKSTLVRIIGGTEYPDSGKVIRNARISWPMGYSGGFVSSLTGRENARFVARIYGAKSDYIENFTQEFAELGFHFDMPLKSYSAGMRSRFALSVSLACDFEVYLVDETMETGDARYKEKCRRVFAERKERSSIILVSHNESAIRRNCDQAAILHRGRLDYYEDLDEAFKHYRLLQTKAA
ncbi:MAG: ABC transporter ATP-binding protein [Gammaproteobacteria bacterium]|nr:ABC transporter ATP-binding protein [Gammaproteobacteria bacterium]